MEIDYIMGKFGKKNVIKVDPTAYNTGIIGESGIGKTSVMVEVLEKLVGSDGYMILNTGMEDGIDAIPGASYEDIPDFDTLVEFTDDVTKNKKEDYPDLKVVVIDTMDELFRIVEPYIVYLHNKEYKGKPDKQVKSIKAAFGGYQAGEDKAVDEILKVIKRLNDVGVRTWFVGHTKRKNQTDIATGDEYETLTANLVPKYFNAVKTKLHFLGVASIDRTIEKHTVKQKIGADKVIGKVKDENRIITFRDNNFNIDSKSRFKDIIPQIPLDADEFIKAMEDAIKVAFDKQNSKKSFEETKVEQEKAKEEKVSVVIEQIKESEAIDENRNIELADQIKLLYGKSTTEQKAVVKGIMGEYGIQSFAPEQLGEVKTEGLEKVVEALS